MTYSGVLLGESLQVGARLEDIPLTVTRIFRLAAGDVTVGQPEIWTFIEFNVGTEEAERLAGALSRVLRAEGGWYCNFQTESDIFVVFRERIFRYQRGDQVARAEAENFARSAGVPESQLDWPR
jgi:hypothetical protein